MSNKKDYSTDIHELVNKEVCNHMRPFIEATMSEHQQTRDEVKSLKSLVCDLNKGPSTHDVVQYALVIMIFVLMFAIPACLS